MDNLTIKKILEEKHRTRQRVTIMLDGENYKRIKLLAKIHDLPVSYLIDAAIEIAMIDKSFNPTNKDLEEQQ